MPSGAPVALFQSKVSLAEDYAGIVVERFKSRTELKPEEISDLTAKLELELLKDNQPATTNASVKLVTSGTRRLVVIDYTRPGLTVPERVRQYTYLIRTDVYRLTCYTALKMFDRYLGTCETVAESFKPAGEFKRKP
jgi:hypothetical protein